MKKLTYNMIKDFHPCYDPIKYIPESWEGTVVDILKMDNIPFRDRLWCVLRTDLVSEKTMRLFAVWSYRQTLKFVDKPYLASIHCANVAEKFANGLATREELIAARAVARDAAYAAARAAAGAAASAAWAAAWAAADSAAWAAAYAAAGAAESAANAAGAAARAAAGAAQKDKLIEIIEIEDKNEKR